jgi:hypothetical protein
VIQPCRPWFYVRALHALLRGCRTRKAAIRRSPTFRPMLEHLEFRGAPSDMAGNMPAFAIAAALPTPAVVMANGWSAGAAPVTAAPTGGSDSVQIVSLTGDSLSPPAATPLTIVDPSTTTTASNSLPPTIVASDPTAAPASDAVFTDAAATGPDLFQNPLGTDPVTDASVNSSPAQPLASVNPGPTPSDAGGSIAAVNPAPAPSVSTDNTVAAPAAPTNGDAGFPSPGQPSNANIASNPATASTPSDPAAQQSAAPSTNTPDNTAALQSLSADGGTTAMQLSPEFTALLASMAPAPTGSDAGGTADLTQASAAATTAPPDAATAAAIASATTPAAIAPVMATPAAPSVSPDAYSPPTVSPENTTDAAAASSTQTAAAAPSGAASTSSTDPAATPAPQIDTTYNRHYTDSGHNDNAAFYLDVTIAETGGPNPMAGAANQPPTSQYGTVTYTAWLTIFGVSIYNYTDVVVSFNSSDGGLYNWNGDSAAAGALVGLGGGGNQIWNHEEWDESASRTAGGTFTGADGSTFHVSAASSLTDWWTTDHTVIAPNYADMLMGVTPVGSVTDAKSYGLTYSSDSTVSDLAAGLPSSDPVVPNSYPTDLLAAPPTDATYLVRYFNSGSTDGTSTTTTVFGGSTSAVTHDHYTGLDGYRDFETYAANTGDATNAANPSTDHRTALLNYQRKGSYGGTRDSNLTTVGFQGATGSTTDENHDAGTIFANQSDYQDVYHRDDGRTVVDGTFKANSGDALVPSTYSDSQTSLQAYQNSWLLTTDQLTYHYARSTDMDVAVSDDSVITVADHNGPLGLVSSTTDEVASVSVTGTWHSESDSAGVLDLLNHTSTVNSSGSYLNHGDSTATDHQYYLAADASTDRTTDSLVTGWGVASGDYSASGGVNATGQQTDGTSHVHTVNLSDYTGKVTTTTTGIGMPVQKSIVKTGGDLTADATSELTYNSDGTANGSVNSNSDSSARLETTVTAIGDYAIPNGTGSANDLDHRKTRDDLHTHTDITLAYGLASGTATSETDHHTDFDHSFKRTLDLDDNSLHSLLTSSGAGSVASTDVVNASVYDGILTGTRTFDFNQHDLSSSHLAANGNLSDSNGYTGTWTFDSTSTDTVGGVSAQDSLGNVTADPNGQDNLHQTFVWQDGVWAPVARTVTVGDASTKTSLFHQEDNGLGMPAPLDSSIPAHYVHTVDVEANLKTLTLQAGTPTDYTFQTKSYQENDTKESRNRTWSDDNGSSGSYDAITHNSHALRDDHNGAVTAGIVTQDQIHQVKEDSNYAKMDAQDQTPQYFNEVHKRDYVSLTDTRDGDMAPGGSGTGSRDFIVDHRYWWKHQDKTAYWPFQWSSGGDPNAPQYQHHDDLSWGGPSQFVPLTLTVALWQDFVNSPTGQWLGEHAGDLLRVVGGAVDFGVGFTMTLGSGGLAAFPGVGLMAIGIDQMFVGETAIAFGARPPSIFESVGSFGATAVGANDQTAQIVGTWTPAALSLLFTLGGGLLAGSTSAGGTATASAPGSRFTIGGVEAIELPGRLSPAEMAALQQANGTEFAQIYLTGPGRNGGGGTYYLIQGVEGSVSIPIGPNVRWINHTHPAMVDGLRVRLTYSAADQNVLRLLQQAGSPQMSSQIVPELGLPFLFQR